MNPDYLLQDPYPFHISQASIEQAQAEILKEYAHHVEERAKEIEIRQQVVRTAEELVHLVDGNASKKISLIRVLRNIYRIGLRESKDYIDAALNEYHNRTDLPF